MKSCPACQASYPTNFAVCPQDGTALIEMGAWSEGTVVRGKYRVLGKLGQGGMGSVYKALHLAFEEQRALKVMSPELLIDELFVKRFKQEAVLTRKLHHPNAVRVDDIDEAEDGRPFIVMEYIEGQSLKKLILDHGPLPAARACNIAKQVAAALEAAHRLGMVHRDIKPENIVLVERPEGEQAKVLDFGIAKLKEARVGGSAGMTLTGTGVVVGTPQYMSPEQAMGKRGDDLDWRSDIYSLGIVMYQMLTGELPFKADTTLELLMAHMQTPPTPIRALRPKLQIPEPIANLVMKCLEKQRESRPATAKALIEEIERFEQQTVVAPGTVVLPPTVVSRQVLRAARPETAGGEPAARPAPALREKESPLPPEPPRPQGHPVAPAPAVAPARNSHWGLWVSIAILVAGLGTGAWYFTTQRVRTNPSIPGSSTERTAHTPVQTKPVDARSRSEAGQPAPQHEIAPETQETNTAKPVPPPATRTETTSGTEQTSQPTTGRRNEMPRGEGLSAKPSADRKEISAAIARGDIYYENGEYRKAIHEYQKGLSLEPFNRKLRFKLQRARKAMAAEERVLR